MKEIVKALDDERKSIYPVGYVDYGWKATEEEQFKLDVLDVLQDVLNRIERNKGAEQDV